MPGETLGRQPAVRLLVLRRSCQPGRGECPAGACARLPSGLSNTSLACALPAVGHALDGARRAPRAFKDVRDIHHRFSVALGGRPVAAH